ncbi:MAG: glycosyltransferase, partial [Actinomycetota bacterium]
GLDADLVSTPQGYLRVRRRPHHRPLVSVIIPTRGTVGSVWGLESPYIENLLLSIASRSTYPHVEFVVVFDTGTDGRLLERLVGLPLEVKLVEFSGRFNFSRKCNIGTLQSSGDRLIFLNDDMELITPDWIECLVAMLEEPDVGAVGPLLLYENGLVQSAGHINPGPVHFARGMSPSSSIGAAWPLVLNREVSGITGACLAMRRETFLDCGGFSELFAEAFNDVDLCFKLMAAGYRILWTPDVQLFHFESKSRIPDVDMDAISDLMRYWGRHVEQGKTDPFTTL